MELLELNISTATVFLLYGCEMSQNLSLNNFEWIKDISQFNEDFIKN